MVKSIKYYLSVELKKKMRNYELRIANKISYLIAILLTIIFFINMCIDSHYVNEFIIVLIFLLITYDAVIYFCFDDVKYFFFIICSIII